MESDNDLLNEFVLEATTHIAKIEAGLLRLEDGDTDDEIINGIFRAAHTIKGTASFFELHAIVELSHAIEALFDELRNHSLDVSAEMIDTLLSATDMLKELISSPEQSHPISDQVTRLRNLLPGSPHRLSQSEQHPALISTWELWDQLTSADEQKLKSSAADAASSSAFLQDRKPVKESITSLPLANREIAVAVDKLRDDSVRVNVDLLDDLLNLAGEMVLRRNQLLRIAQDIERQYPQIDAIAKGIDELTTDLQKKVMKTRLQPIANVFNKFPRIVRDLSRKVSKEVDLVLQGTSVELDRSLIEALIDPMTHLVRNALDHGIESPEDRVKYNKPPSGLLVLHAYQESGRVIINVSDDGAGINWEKVKTKAIQKGLISDKDIAVMSEADIMNLILMPGFSTADQVTAISGRGVGMDVVRTNIEKLGGKVEIISTPGAGTTFRLVLPLSLAIVSALIVVSNGQSYVIPQANVKELLLIEPGNASENRLARLNSRPVLRLRGRVLPLIRLGDVLSHEQPSNYTDFERLVSAYSLLRVLVVKTGDMSYGLIVDSIFDTEEILVKPLPTILSNCGLYSGVTVLGDGSIAMILDTDALPLQAGVSTIKDTLRSDDVSEIKQISEEKQYLLLFQCSGGETLGLDLAMVSRVEKIQLAQLQKIGTKYYFAFNGQTIRVIRPEHYLPFSSKKNALSTAYVILPKLVKQSIGILAEKILDTVNTTVSLDKDGVCGKGILGSTQIDDTVVTLLDLHSLFAEAAPEYAYQLSARNRYKGASFPNTVAESQKLKILLVEDTPFFLKLVTSYLESDGYEVIPAVNGRQALEILLQTKVDIVVSDIEMPLMTGIELVRAIRSNEALHHLPVIALTSLTGEVNKEKGLRAGFDVYEYKLDRARLLDTIRTCWKKHNTSVQESELR